MQQADVTKEEEVQRVIKLTMEKYGRIDVLFNNAGVMPTAPLIEAPKGEWRQMLDINIMGVLNGIAAVLPIMVEQKSGQIIATDSVAGHVVYPDSAVYCGTKFAVRAIMEGLPRPPPPPFFLIIFLFVGFFVHVVSLIALLMPVRNLYL